MATWSMAEAEKNFDELLDRAVSEGPQYITRDGAQVAVVALLSEERIHVREEVVDILQGYFKVFQPQLER